VKNLIFESVIFDIQLTKKIVAILYKYGIQSVIIEGGKQTLQSFIEANFWDEARVFTGTVLFKDGVKGPFLKGISKTVYLKEDQLKLFTNHD